MHTDEVGQNLPAKISGNRMVVPQPKGADGRYKYHDSVDVGAHVGGHVFKKNKALFSEWLPMTMDVSKRQASEMWNKLDKGEPVKFGGFYKGERERKFKTFEEVVRYFDSGLHRGGPELRSNVVKKFKDDMNKKGVTHLEYQNTLRNEIETSPYYDHKRYSVLEGRAKKAYKQSGKFYPEDMVRDRLLQNKQVKKMVGGAEDPTAAIVLNQDVISPAFGRGLIK